MQPHEIKAALDLILPGVQRPGRYVGLESNQVRKPWEEIAVRLLLAFPDEYGIGMSHQGTRILYHVANRRPDTLAERAFAPWPDMAEAMRRHGVPLYSLETTHAAADFDLIGITLQSELNLVNVPYLLDLAGLPRWARDRRDGHPLVVGGGPCMANPEPVADFFDVLAIGDGEVLLPRLLDAVRDAKSGQRPRAELLRRLAEQDGFYVPSLYRWVPAAHPSQGGRHEREEPWAPLRIRRVWVDDLDLRDIPPLPLVPAVEAVQDRLGLEVARGCTRGCRFCQAGFWYRPVREHDPAGVLERLEAHVDATGYEEVSLLSLSSADYSQIGPLAAGLADRLSKRRVGVSLPSLRADAFSVELADAVSRVRKSGFTFAPETGSERLRRVINKDITNDDMRTAAAAAFSRGWDLIKLYGMLGLPTETDDDVEALAALATDLLDEARRAGRRKAEIKLSANPFVPKAWTPFQWEPLIGEADFERRVRLLRDRCRPLRSVKLGWGEHADARLEALLARGDRRLGAVIARAHDLGAVFDGWNEQRRPDAWARAFEEHGLDLEAELGARELDATLPWEIIDPGFTRAYMRLERERAMREEPTPDCRQGRCTGCGIPGAGSDLRFAAPSLPPAQLAELAPRTRRNRPAAEPQPETRLKARLTYAKTGDARWLSHRNVMDLLERALRASGFPVRFTEGFNPHVRVSMGPALPLGAEALAEPLDVDLHAPVELGLVSRANRLLPEGLEITSCEMLPEGASSLGRQLATFRLSIVRPADLGSWPATLEAALADVDAGAELAALAPGIYRWQRDGETLRLILNARQTDGPTPGLRDLLAALRVPAEALPRLRVRREGWETSARPGGGVG